MDDPGWVDAAIQAAFAESKDIADLYAKRYGSRAINEDVLQAHAVAKMAMYSIHTLAKKMVDLSARQKAQIERIDGMLESITETMTALHG